MALVRPLRLKSEVFKRAETELADVNPIAQVWVDNGVYHLDQSFDYAIPISMAHAVQVGIRVEVPFNGKPCEGLVIGRASSSTEKLKNISKIISNVPAANSATIELIRATSRRWAAHPYDVIRSAIPPRVASVEKDSWNVEVDTRSSDKSRRIYFQLPPSLDRIVAINEYMKDLLKDGSVLLVVPDSRLAAKIHADNAGSILLDSQLDRSERYRNFITASVTSPAFIIGTRSAIFAPISNLSTIVIFDEGSEHHYEKRSPGWNVRDVAILRSQLENVSLAFLGYSPSSEVARLIEIGWLDYQSRREKVSIKNFSQSFAELLPGRIIAEIRAGLKSGSVLFIVPRKGYSQAISCSKCRNLALCECGGKLSKSSLKSNPQCVLCGKVDYDWRCIWCQGVTPFLIGRGSQRFAQEIGAAFSGIAIKSSEGDHIIEDVSDFQGFVIATPGSIPSKNVGYSRVVVLEGNSYFNQSDVRAQERARELIFSAAAYLSKNGVLLTVMSDSHPILGAISAWKPALVSQQELRERAEVHLPPYSRALTLDAESIEIRSIVKGLESAQSQGRLPASMRILGPLKMDGEKSRIVVTAPIQDGEKLVELVHEFQRRRSISKKTLASLRIDPYSLTR